MMCEQLCVKERAQQQKAVAFILTYCGHRVEGHAAYRQADSVFANSVQGFEPESMFAAIFLFLCIVLWLIGDHLLMCLR